VTASKLYIKLVL